MCFHDVHSTNYYELTIGIEPQTEKILSINCIQHNFYEIILFIWIQQYAIQKGHF